MAENDEKTVETTTETTAEEAQREAEYRRAFLEGADEEAPVTKAEPETGKTEQPTEVAEEKPAAVAEPEKPAEPKYVQFTEDEAALLRGGLEKLVKLEGSVSSVSGNVGHLKQLVESVRTGGKVEITDDDLKPFEEIPELKGPVKQVLETVISRARVIAEPAKIDAAEMAKAIEEKVAEQVRKAAHDELMAEYPNWHELVGWKKGATQVDETVPYRVWLKAQPADYQKKIAETNDPSEVRRSITRQRRETAAAARRAKEAAKPPQPRGDDGRFIDAVQPKGDGGAAQVPKEKTYADLVREGFANM